MSPVSVKYKLVCLCGKDPYAAADLSLQHMSHWAAGALAGLGFRLRVTLSPKLSLQHMSRLAAGAAAGWRYLHAHLVHAPGMYSLRPREQKWLPIVYY
jgi:hypothetical protein